MSAFSRPRRFATAALAFICGAVLFHAQVADALVVRGDDLMYAHRQAQALERYRRALLFDSSSQTAADRYVFLSMQVRTKQSLSRAVAVANAFLAAHPDDVTILADRALCELITRRYANAQADFTDAAQIARDPRYYVFAGWAAQRLGQHARAVALWQLALNVRPKFRPALIALAEHRTR